MGTKWAASAICAMLAIVATPLAASAETAAGSWTATASMAVPRDNLTATTLDNGRVLVVGGVDELGTELYGPPTGAWLPTLNETHWGHDFGEVGSDPPDDPITTALRPCS